MTMPVGRFPVLSKANLDTVLLHRGNRLRGIFTGYEVRRCTKKRTFESRRATGEKLERVEGIEPSTKAWEAFVLPLNYTRFFRASLHAFSG
jgi:hypothetical protein